MVAAISSTKEIRAAHVMSSAESKKLKSTRPIA
jgi:hypothetical protein